MTRSPLALKGTVRVTRRIWDVGDDYLVVPIGDIQVSEDMGWRIGDEVGYELRIVFVRAQIGDHD